MLFRSDNKVQAVENPKEQDAKIASEKLTLDSSDEIGLSVPFTKK